MLNRALRLADRASRATGLLQARLDPTALLARAAHRHGLDVSTEPGVAEALAMELAALDDEAGLSLFGRLAARWDAARLLATLARLQSEERDDPVILAREVSAPIIITGLPRSGTTFLHRLLAEDPDLLVPRCWRTIHPYPPRRGPDRRRAQVDREFRTFSRLTPGLARMHPLAADTPQECTEITAHVFQSLRFDTTHRVPSYRRWLDGRGHVDAYRFHRRFLQHLQGPAARGPWVLKCPDHVFALPDLLAVYPDARLVFVHRDPLKVLASVARLTEMIRAPFTRALDRAEIGRQVAARWADGAAIMARGETPCPAGNVTHLHYREIIADPVGTARALYYRFGMPLHQSVAERMRLLAERERSAGAGGNAYRLEEYGLDRAELSERFAEYVACFDVTLEGPPAPHHARPTLRGAV